MITALFPTPSRHDSSSHPLTQPSPQGERGKLAAPPTPSPLGERVGVRGYGPAHSKPDRGVEQHFRFERAVVAARYCRQRARVLDAGADAVLEAHADARAGRMQRQARAVAAEPVPDLRGVVEDVRLDRLDEVLVDPRVVAELDRAAGPVVAGDGARIVAAADLIAA